MATNDKQTLLARKAASLGTFTRFRLQPFPALPDSFLKRFPELIPYAESVKRWSDNLNSELEKQFSAQQQ